MYGLEISHQCDKRVKSKSQTDLRANSYVYRSYRGKTGTKTSKKLQPIRKVIRLQPIRLGGIKDKAINLFTTKRQQGEKKPKNKK